MSNFCRFFSFVPPFLLFCFPVFSQLQGKIELLPGSNTFQVSVIPLVNWAPPQSATSSAQVTLRAPSGKLNISDFQSITGVWSQQTPVGSPAEAPSFDYFSFSLNLPITNLTYLSGSPVILFSFKNASGCTYIELVDNQNDPFLPPNSINVNIGNSFAVIGAGIGQNAYTGNSTQDFVECPPLGLISAAQHNPVLCHNDLTSITLQAFNGKEPYQVDWNNLSTGALGSLQINTFGGQTVLDNMSPGTYIFSIKDALDSLDSDTLLISNPSPIRVELAAFDASCNGSLDGSVYVSEASGGTVSGDYQYYWETNPLVSSYSAGFLDPGIYTVTVSDDNGCTTTDSVEVSTFLLIYLNPIVRDISCHGASDGVIDLYPVGNNAPFTFQWSSNVSTGPFSSAWKLGPGQYMVTVTDATGVCYQTGEYWIEEPPAIEVLYTLDKPRCNGEKGYLSILGVENAIGNWKMDIAGGNDLGTGQDFEIEPGTKLTLSVQDSKGCTISNEFAIPAKQELQLDLGDNYLIKYGETVKLDPDYFPFENVSFEWTPSESLSCPDCPDPVASPLKDVTYHLVMKDTTGCQVEDFVTVRVYKSRDIYIPNAFSPNNDGINDLFYPFAGFEVTSIQNMKIFDRWGGLLFETGAPFPPNDFRAGWDGTARGKIADVGVYLYTLDVEFIDGEVVLFAGEVNLIR